ncbi:MAG: hypothetical protein FJ297_09955 [Planctomycetes bacterium]|nr:hypothetical protein [Planctomycetota bacterium]
MIGKLGTLIVSAVVAFSIGGTASVGCGQTSPSDQDASPPPQAGPMLRSLKDVDRRIQPPGEELPPDQSAEILGEWSAREGQVVIPYYWEAPEIWHNPLYFDDVLLERYGQTAPPRLQPYVSGAHFFLQFPILPYKATIDRPFDCKTNLGYYRPGSPAPCVGRRMPLQADAALVETGVWIALLFVLP